MRQIPLGRFGHTPLKRPPFLHVSRRQVPSGERLKWPSVGFFGSLALAS
jgi:hypothetical protein